MTFSAMIDSLFEDPIIAKDATYTPSGGSPAADPVRVIVSRPDEKFESFERAAVIATCKIEVRLSEVAAAAKGDQFEIAGAAYQVVGKPKRDGERLTWVCEAADA